MFSAVLSIKGKRLLGLKPDWTAPLLHLSYAVAAVSSSFSAMTGSSANMEEVQTQPRRPPVLPWKLTHSQSGPEPGCDSSGLWSAALSSAGSQMSSTSLNSPLLGRRQSAPTRQHSRRWLKRVLVLAIIVVLKFIYDLAIRQNTFQTPSSMSAPLRAQSDSQAEPSTMPDFNGTDGTGRSRWQEISEALLRSASMSFSRLSSNVNPEPDIEPEREEEVELALTAPPRPSATSRTDESEQPSEDVDSPQPTPELDSPQASLLSVSNATALSRPARLPRCRRTMLFTLSPRHGFASEWNTINRLQLLADRFGYVLVFDDHLWNYGQWSDYFEPIEYGCRPPFVRERRRAQIEKYAGTDSNVRDTLARPHWTRSRHISASHIDLHYLDDLILDMFTNASRMTRIHHFDLLNYPPALPLSGTDTLPPYFEAVFAAISQANDRIWKPNAVIRGMIDNLRAALIPPVPAPRPTIVGAHIRLGDKCNELGDTKLSPLRFAKPSVLAQYKLEKAKTICAELRKGGGLDDEKATIFLQATEVAVATVQVNRTAPTSSKPKLVLMSDDPHVMSALEAHVTDASVNIVSTSTALPQANNAFKGGFPGQKFNDLPLAMRVGNTQEMLRDLTFFREEADAVLLTGSSNVGRLLMTLVGPSRCLNNRCISADVRYFPTAYFS
ncbi:uncharacterized protein L969DRAFT_96165 [Mixia osmundae IAM 14324]|uniref:Uncharacterized protein n=1 Tax=Mixia osmundae (strain CBS 9802 / IAM 14324 / JCM 22182 / KY 12970) TaxID=764103 RepID=G7E4R3_MIXOS|nr:uncharacterized protein L969DRAFT_96165 [Mixia osmundae IAM 14324]KEI37644.1 hypothetical protein L969DRAFT_96165 [Mixia osmundae IAM 14324]GAA97823.1 hypothetical protein E5Q_04502 [Mixia osmundae IAM 14324]